MTIERCFNFHLTLYWDNTFEIVVGGFFFCTFCTPDLFPIWSGARTCQIYVLGKYCYNKKQSKCLGFKIIGLKGTQSYENMWQLRARFSSPLTKIDSLDYGDLKNWRWNQQWVGKKGTWKRNPYTQKFTQAPSWLWEKQIDLMIQVKRGTVLHFLDSDQGSIKSLE